MPQAAHHKPCGLLRDLEVLGERRGGKTFRVVGNQPDRHEPFSEREFCIFENGADLDRKPLAAIAAFEGFKIRKAVDSTASAVGAKLAVPPADGAQMIEARLLVRECGGEIKEAFDLDNHVRLRWRQDTPNQIWVNQIYNLSNAFTTRCA